ncbi:hypothetical protein AAU57_10300 [Nonlabens sp. YIK11]|uniref:glycosyltransferase n=1 Tax=Nonlabens sp. YIK11 TaxID=1453349 RepID=UPI0006DC2965|nr:glycosyltransferase family 4 protein [Nonlabens sp. YIK11]KQC33672.1 hypothetical protein AAU57_10300 [Nonlabens sp. YIK11]
MKKLLVIGYIWPEPTKTAAGYRILQLIDLFLEQEYEVVFCCAARLKQTAQPSLKERRISTHGIDLHKDSLDQLLLEFQPAVVLYDRFLIEEQYGWRVRNHAPQAIQILDTEDLHFLRTAREQQVLQGTSLQDGFESELALREISSMNRVDLSLIISRFEMELLQDDFPVDPETLFYIPFLVEGDQVNKHQTKAKPFEERQDYCTIGNLRHAPNVDAVEILKTEIWPIIRANQPEAQLFIYGPNAPQKILDLHDPDSGFLIKGHAADVEVVLSKHKVLLAPLRFGAGLKGKIFDAMKNGLAIAGTAMAFEGIRLNDAPATGSWADFAEDALDLSTNPSRWQDQVNENFEILKRDFEKSAFAKALFLKINDLKQHHPRKRSLVNKIALHHADAHFKFINYWINAKKN